MLQMDLKRSDLDLDLIKKHLDEDGLVVVRNTLSHDELASIQSQWRQIRDPLREGRSVVGLTRQAFYVNGKLPSPLGTVYQHPNVVAISQRLLGPDVALYLNRVNVKDKKFLDLVHLHQDMPYFNGGTDKVNFFIAVEDINLNNGGMVFVPGSHRLGMLDVRTIDIAKHPELEVVVPSLSAGDLMIADIRLWHSSVQNSVGTDRPLLQMIFQPATDGSYFPPTCPEPVLVSGQWRTDQFPPWTGSPGKSASMAQDAASTAAPTASAGVLTALKRVAKAVLPDRIKDIARNWFRARSCPLAAPTASAGTLAALKGVAKAVLPDWIMGILRKLRARSSPLPMYFTPSTGPLQVWPAPEEKINWPAEMNPTANLLRGAGKTRILLGVRRAPASKIVRAAAALGLQVVGYLHIAQPGEARLKTAGNLPVYLPRDLPGLRGIDAVVVLCTGDFALAARQCEQFLRADVLFVPGAREAVTPEPVRKTTPEEWVVRSSILTYLQVSGLRGHFAEFGTFWGRAFFASYFELQHWLEGKFFAFDSFAGLSDPLALEKEYTSGDFKKGAYGFSHDSFRALASILGLPAERIITVPGFFDQSLTRETASELGLKPKSISVCRIDCDLLDPTSCVLEFIAPLLDDGALVYFDDWRLCRADPNIGERGAVARWLKAHPAFELVDFPSTHWQHQWFIFHRNKFVESVGLQAAPRAA